MCVTHNLLFCYKVRARRSGLRPRVVRRVIVGRRPVTSVPTVCWQWKFTWTDAGGWAPTTSGPVRELVRKQCEWWNRKKQNPRSCASAGQVSSFAVASQSQMVKLLKLHNQIFFSISHSNLFSFSRFRFPTSTTTTKKEKLIERKKNGPLFRFHHWWR